jgi:hypothetical protein
VVVDEVARVRKICDGRAEGKHRPKDGNFALITDHHTNVAGLVENRDEAVVFGFGEVFIVGFVKGAASHVAYTGVGIMRNHRELLGGAHGHDALLWKNFDARDDRIVGIAVRHALGNPTHEQTIVVRTGVNALATAVRERGYTFEEKKASLWRRGK